MEKLARYYLKAETQLDWLVVIESGLTDTDQLICRQGGKHWVWRHKKYELIGIHEFLFQLDLIIKKWKAQYDD